MADDVAPTSPEGSSGGGALFPDEFEDAPQVPEDKWVRQEESDAEKVLTSITGHHAAVRLPGRPLPPPKRFRPTTRKQSVAALFFVLALSGVSCFGLLKLVSGGARLLRPHIAATTTPPKVASPSGTATSHK
jgi:hypothetical protein